jgi:signal transduction histidine kinase
VQRSSTWLQKTGRESDLILLVSESIVQTNRLAKSIFDYVKSGGEPVVQENAEEEGRAMLHIVDQLRGINKNDRDIQGVIERFSERVTQIISDLKTVANKHSFSQFELVEIHLSDSFDAAVLDSSLLLNILKERHEDFIHSVEMEERSCQQARLISSIGFSLNVLIAVALAFYMQRTIIRRISDLKIKARNFNDELFDYKPVIGVDEFSQLDSEIFAARKQWLESYRFRKIFMSMMAKRLRKPLQTCGEAAAVISQETAVHDVNSAKRLQTLVVSVTSCLNLIDDMVLLAGSDGKVLTIHPEVASIRVVAGEAVELISSLAANKKVSIENQCENAMLSIDIALTKQVLVNLLSNAIKFSPAGSVITIKSEKRQENLRMSVIDRGAGMTEEVRSQLFQKFYQSVEGKSVGGTGLGLAIAQMIVQAHEGTIGVDSGPGQGSSFWFEYPAAL